ncbi:MAG: hypothetical protein M3442_03895 [Chloroflexota bacterium]|nr:hypothetical protein [Chloroflexota bacterium]
MPLRDLRGKGVWRLPDAPLRALSGLARALDFFHPTAAGAEIRARLAVVAGTATDPALLGS